MFALAAAPALHVHARTHAPSRSHLAMGLATGEKFPSAALKDMGVSGKPAVVFFYGADDAPSCSTEIGIEKDLFGLLGGRETYVVAADGTVASVFNSQFDPDAHVKTATEAVELLPKSPLDELKAKVEELTAALP